MVKVAKIALLAIVAAFVVVAAASEAEVTFKLFATSATCVEPAAATNVFPSSEDGECYTVNPLPKVSSNINCSDTGVPEGNICGNDCSDSCTALNAPVTTTWGDVVCVPSGGYSLSVSCSLVVEPPTAPPAEPTPVTPQAPAPVAPVAPVAPTPSVPLMGQGNVTIQAWLAKDCPGASITTNSLFADFSLCQPISYATYGTFYFRVDCFVNNTLKGQSCGSDSSCSECQDMPIAASAVCYNTPDGAPAPANLLKSSKYTCPTIVAPKPPTQPTPTPSAASSLVASVGFVAAALLALSIF